MTLFTQSKISRALMVYILFFSSLITLLVTGISVYFEYKQDLSIINKNIDQIEKSYLASISNTLWQFDTIQLKTLITGISKIPDVTYVEVTSNEDVLYSIGVIPKLNMFERSYDLTRSYALGDEDASSTRSLGKLRIVTSLAGVYARLKTRILVILLTQAIKTFLVSAFIYLIVQTLITKRLSLMANFLSSFEFEKDNKSLRVNRDEHGLIDELDLVANSINEMHGKLKENYLELQETEENLRKLSSKLISSQEEERARISRDLHDDIGQKLTVLKLNFAKYFRNLEMTDSDLQDRRSHIFAEIDTLVAGVRHVAKSLLPSILFSFGIVDALKWLIEESFKNSNIEYQENIELVSNIGDQELNLTIFRIVQEGLNNIIKYADASFVEVELFRDDNDDVVIKVSDNGVGVTRQDIAKSNSTGIVGIRERLRPYQGTFEIGTKKNGGTLIKAVIPTRNI